MRATTLTQGQHARLIDDLVTGKRQNENLDPRIVESWKRCAHVYGMDPGVPGHINIVGNAELRARRERLEQLNSVAQLEMRALAGLLNAPVGVLLTDAEGIVLGYAGSHDFDDTARRAGLREGADWRERQQGTNGVGTCLINAEPVLIRKTDHFKFEHVALTCCAAPIWDGAGQLVGALNLSGYLTLSPAPTMALVKLAVQNIENRVLLWQHHPDYVLRFHPHREFISTAGEGLVAIHRDGTVVAANHAALEWLGIANHHQLCGRQSHDALGISLGWLAAAARTPNMPRILPTLDHGSLCFGIVQSTGDPAYDAALSGIRAIPPRPGSGASVLAEAESRALRSTLASCHWNVSRAAEELGISRRTLHRKLKSFGIYRGAN